jgi:hypothetical protein
MKTLTISRHFAGHWVRWLCFCACAQSLLASTYYLSPVGSDTNVGSLALPWATLNQAAAVVQPGDTVILEEGTYYVYPVSIFSTSGTASSPITIEGVDTNAIISGAWINANYYNILNLGVGTAGEPTGNSLLQLNGLNNVASNIVFNFLASMTAKKSNVKAVNLSGTNDILLNSVFLNLSNSTAVQMAGMSNTVSGCYLSGCYDLKNFVIFGNWNTVSNCVITNMLYDGLGNHPDFVQSFGDNDTSATNIITTASNFLACNNLIVNCPNGMQMWYLSLDQSSAFGYFDGFTFRNNIFINAGNSGDSGYPHTYIYNNLFINSGYNQGQPVQFFNKGATGTGNGNLGIASNSACLNNIFIACGDGTSNPDDGYVENDGAPGVVIDYNYVCMTNYQPVSASYFGAGFGNNTINGGTPGFVNQAALNFDLLTNSILVGKGTNIPSFNTDFNGNLRPASRWSIGPIEPFVPPLTAPTGFHIVQNN